MSSRAEAVERDLLWQAVLERDERYDGIVYYAVSTTGVYCRPVCPSRRPRPENVTFFHDRGEARRRGFRPCKRCRPDTVPEAGGERALLLEACRRIGDAGDAAPTLETLAGALAESPDRIRRLFRRLLGVSPKQYADAVRLERFKQAVAAGGSVAEATYDAGYGSASRLYERAGRQLGMTPAAYQRRGRGQRVLFWTWVSRLGPVLLAATARGVCSVKLGRPAEVLEAELRRELAAAIVVPAEAGLGPQARALDDYLEGRTGLPELPVDVVATAFQARVWAALREIPSGETASYADVAERIGAPRAVRAVASACARNPVAIVVPCHRVVPKHGSAAAPGKYRWGSAAKRALLEMEAAGAAAAKSRNER